MPELRDRYDASRVSDRIIQPPFAELAARGRRRAHRTRTVRLAGVAVVTALIATLLPLLGEPGASGPDVASSPAAPPTGSEPVVRGTYDRAIEFFDIDHGVVYYHAVELPGTVHCGAALAVTDDRGATWSGWRELPAFPHQRAIEDRTACLPVWVVPVAPDTLLIPIDAELMTSFADVGLPIPTSSFISRDAGQTWHEYEPKVRTAEALPDGVVPYLGCPTEIGCQDELYWYDPQTGDRVVALNTPPATTADRSGRGQVTVAADGSIWVTGLDASGAYHVSVSRDRGRTWVDRSPASVNLEEFPDGGVRTFDGTTGYFFWAPPAEEKPERIHVYRTMDGGETWHPLPAQPPFENDPRGRFGIWAASDGLVLADATGNAYLISDGAAAFEEVELNVTPGELVRGSSFHTQLDQTMAVSEDGLTWREYALPDPPYTR